MLFRSISADNPAKFKSGMDNMLVGTPDEVLNLVCQYMKLDSKEIEQKATDKEILEAFEVVVEIAFCLVPSPARAVARISQ